MEDQSIIKIFDEKELEQLIKDFQLKCPDVDYISSKHQLDFSSAQSRLSIRLPYCIEYKKDRVIAANFLIIIIHSGEAALAYSEENQIVEHKMVKAYMVRQKQGKSQIKHLKTKGKSKAGSRVRLAGTDHFFEEINEKIAEWDEYFNIERIAISCNKTLQPYLYNRPDAALQKDDQRLLKIPKHIQEANFDNLTHIHNYLISTELKFDNSDKEFINDIISEIDND
ncbi:hypothetical protein MATR_14940 [Marivirga tractuosa]|uniref:VLRF1 domain-containing protein n=1 Tax=Marivirga tractuosa (strain ATCC 23168 / DSM 4126 / NBRC 15989 / NCIMB 1408 / VKM B-1430 / H-43) TaxID=643867 RepID=E4TT32_MARTH|nr:hypothetical protein [Marivirga tractuosa]ADR20880.1 hypothetical protein Ftrac_0878 [Marivirga tractuosa DSM 4126]BDD14669.1 hypothetical protein MATR_14940 [Marivirga tractuosa]